MFGKKDRSLGLNYDLCIKEIVMRAIFGPHYRHTIYATQSACTHDVIRFIWYVAHKVYIFCHLASVGKLDVWALGLVKFAQLSDRTP